MFDIYIRVSRLGERTEDEATEVYEEQCLRVKDRLSLEIDEIVDETNVGGSVEVADRELEDVLVVAGVRGDRHPSLRIWTPRAVVQDKRGERSGSFCWLRRSS